MDCLLKERLASQRPLPFKARALGVVAMVLIRSMGFTIRFKVDDPENICGQPPGTAVIWALWHNRIFALPLIYKKLMPKIRGVVLTSPSRDGNYLAGLARALGVCAVRGSSSKRGGRALAELVKWADDGFVIGITPDGPRGPRYKLAAGLIKLSQLGSVPIVTLQIDYSSYWAVFKSWDRFQIPKPFSTINLKITSIEPISTDISEEAFEEVRLRIESLLNPNNETD